MWAPVEGLGFPFSNIDKQSRGEYLAVQATMAPSATLPATLPDCPLRDTFAAMPHARRASRV